MKYKLSKPGKSLFREIALPASKSITNRLLIIRALTNEEFTINNISDSDDTRVLQEALKNDSETVNIGHAGTSMRFLTAYYAAIKANKILTGSQRMQNRPIKVLVEALIALGATIKYVNKTGYPPLQVADSELYGGSLEIDGSVSSQYITALLLIAPVLPGGLTINLKNKVISSAYIRLTLKLMEYFGIESIWEGNTISVAHQAYKAKDITVEADWSAASYWYQMAAIADKADIIIHGLSENSLQGDAVLVSMFEPLGVQTTFLDNAVRLTKTSRTTANFEFNFLNCPDLAQTLCVTLAMSRIPFRLSGLDTLKIKETDRIAALINELRKFGFTVSESSEGELTWKKTAYTPVLEESETREIATYKDHRMAMAFAPLVFDCKEIIIQDPLVVTKSYPNYWDDLKKVGYCIDEID